MTVDYVVVHQLQNVGPYMIDMIISYVGLRIDYLGQM
jgi:hypothetical protein